MKKTSWKYLVDVLMFLVMIGVILIGLLLAFVLKEGPAIKESDKFFLGLHRHQWTHIHLYLSIAFTVFLVFHLILAWSWIKGKTRKLYKGAWRSVLGMIVSAAILIPFVFWMFLPKNAPEYYEFGFGRGQSRGQAALTGQARLEALPDPGRLPAGPAEPPPELRHRGETPDSRESRRTAQHAASPPFEERRTGEEAAGEQEHETKLVSGLQESDQAAFAITGRMTLRQVEAETGIPGGRILAKMDLPADISRNEALGRLRRQYGFTLVEFRAAVEALMEKK
ncbi:MAG: DUF4405 domain-containing protein [Candidatus Aminicenantaceae bacterium]